MTLGQTSETVTVTAVDAATLETSSQLVASTLTTKMINQLPLGDRSGALAQPGLLPEHALPLVGSTRYNNLAAEPSTSLWTASITHRTVSRAAEQSSSQPFRYVWAR